MMIKRVLYNGVTWVDIEHPSSEEVAQVAAEFNLHPLVSSELLSPSLRPKIDIHEAYVYLILHFKDNIEIDFVLGEDFIITTRYAEIEPVTKFTRALSIGEQMPDEYFHAGILFYYITRDLYEDVDRALDRARGHLKQIEHVVYDTPDAQQQHEMVLELSQVGHTLLDAEQSIEPHKEVLDSFEHYAHNFYGEHYKRYTNALLGNYYKTHQHIHRLLRLLAELRETNNALLSTKQNDIMQIFTILAFFTFPPSLIASVFGMNTHYIPIVGSPFDFWIVLVLIFASAFGMFSFFRHKRWL